MAAARKAVYVGCMSPRLLALVIAGAALAAGCGQAAVTSSTAPKSQHQPKPSHGLIAESAAATADTGSARAAFTMKMTGFPGASGGVTANGSGLVDFRRRSADLAFHMTVPQSGMTLDFSERMIGTVLYMHSPLFAGAVRKPWIRMDLQKIGKSEGLDMNAAMSSGGNDPSQMLTFLNGASDSIEQVGSEAVRGTPTTRYHVVVDLLKIADVVSAGQRAAVRRTFRREVALIGTHTLPIDVWIDSQGLVRRERLDLSMRPATATAPVEMVMTIDLFDFGAPAHIVAPPARSVADIGDLMGRSPAA
jgi:hypothetical protein